MSAAAHIERVGERGISTSQRAQSLMGRKLFHEVSKRGPRVVYFRVFICFLLVKRAVYMFIICEM